MLVVLMRSQPGNVYECQPHQHLDKEQEACDQVEESGNDVDEGLSDGVGVLPGRQSCSWIIGRQF